MPKTTIVLDTELSLRNEFTKVQAVVTLRVEGRELPTTATLGAAIEEAVTQIQKNITESYVAIPARV